MTEITRQHQYGKSDSTNSERLAAQITGGLRQNFANQVQNVINRAGTKDWNNAVLFLDLDNFRQFNDINGHSIGDKFLILLAEELGQTLGENCLLRRLGGDQFAVLLPKLSCDKVTANRQAVEIGEKMRNAVNERSVFGDNGLELTGSIGIYVFDANMSDANHALTCSEAAMYATKQNGKNQIQLFEKTLLVKNKETATLVSDLREAIEDAELQLKYQPQVDRNGRIIGAESLVRWNHKLKGNIPPDVFIPIAEETGLINPLTDWVMEQALDTLVRWQRHPQLSNLSLSVNVSAPQLHHQQFLERVKNYAQHYTIDMSRLVVEITERVFFGDLKTVQQVMRGLRELDIRFSLDDYGTGYSSLSQLRGLQFDELKIDGMFVKELSTNDNDKAIIRSTLAMAKALGIKCVAEWVETEEQRNFLCDEECDYLQGYLFGPAVSLEEFEQQAIPDEFRFSTYEAGHPYSPLEAIVAGAAS